MRVSILFSIRSFNTQPFRSRSMIQLESRTDRSSQCITNTNPGCSACQPVFISATPASVDATLPVTTHSCGLLDSFHAARVSSHSTLAAHRKPEPGRVPPMSSHDPSLRHISP
ncbi:hypothetical protein OH76DRAFT_1231405 [Lentinus brumalis]|uniref:Uncharacterized protein n=1 Tax=Lentinus brumalis TaxID=2498619 RepID=A0A371CSF2_9APHY|nr:hypothetical protein OH76DRAFT_1231405 [Polyporus brumalis]